MESACPICPDTEELTSWDEVQSPTSTILPPPQCDPTDDPYLLLDYNGERIDFDDVVAAPPSIPAIEYVNTFEGLSHPAQPVPQGQEPGSSVAPVAISVEAPSEVEADQPRRRSWPTMVAAAAMIAGVTFFGGLQSQRPAAAAQSSIAFPSVMVIQGDTPPPTIWVYDLPVVDEGDQPAQEESSPPTNDVPMLGVPNIKSPSPSKWKSARSFPRKTKQSPQLPPFNLTDARIALMSAGHAAVRCTGPKGPVGYARVSVTFAPSGRVTTATVQGAPFAGTRVGGCIASTFRTARIEPYQGGLISVHKTVSFH